MFPISFFAVFLVLLLSVSAAKSHQEPHGLPRIGGVKAEAIAPFDSSPYSSFEQNETFRLWMDDYAPAKQGSHHPLLIPEQHRSITSSNTSPPPYKMNPSPVETTSSTTWHTARRPFPGRTTSDRVLTTSVTYRYYARQRARKQGSVPFLLLGNNNLDHWKDVAERLAKQGFNSIVVLVNNLQQTNGVGVVWKVLSALGWKRVVVVTSDTEAATIGIRAAAQLSNTVLGLVLCGELQERQIVLDLHQSTPPSTLYALDQFLGERLKCPFTIVWDGGGKASYSSPATVNEEEEDLLPEELRPKRTVLIGGGTAPHRRCPDIFAWILTRFVEEKVEEHPSVTPSHPRASSLQPLMYSFGSNAPSLDAVWNEESMVVFGRVVATALFYAITFRILFFQYDNLRDLLQWILMAKQNVVGSMHRLLLGLLAILFPWSKSSDTRMSTALETTASITSGMAKPADDFIPLVEDDDTTLPQHEQTQIVEHEESSTSVMDDEDSKPSDEPVSEEAPSTRSVDGDNELQDPSPVQESDGEDQHDRVDPGTLATPDPVESLSSTGEDSCHDQPNNDDDPSSSGDQGSDTAPDSTCPRPLLFLDYVVT